MSASRDDGLFEREAADEEDEHEDGAGERSGKKKGRLAKASRFHDSSEEDDDEDENEFEKDGFIVDGDEDEEDEEDDSEGENSRVAARSQRERHSRRAEKRKRRRKNSDDDDEELAEGDYMLLEETGHAVNRKRLRRLKKAAGTDDYGDDDFRDLGDEDGDRDDERDDERAAVDEDVDDVDEFDDFIDDGGRGRRRRRQQNAGGVSSDAVRAARSVFGDFEDIQDVYRARPGRQKRNPRGRSGEDSDDAPDDDDSDDEDPVDSDSDGELRKTSKSRLGKGSSSRGSRIGVSSTDDVADATAVAARLSLGVGGALNAEDTAIVERDVPELLQIHMGTRDNATSDEIRRESLWIYERAFATDPAYRSCFNQEEVTRKIESVLTYILVDKMDIPFIAQYRKDYIAPELLYPCGGVAEVVNDVTQERQVLHPKGFNCENYDGFDEAFSIEHERGVKPGYDDGFGDWSPLWKILDWDKEWASLLSLRASVLQLVDTCKKKGVPGNVTELAIERCKEASESEQVADVERYVRLATEAAVALGARDDVDILGLRNPDIPADTTEELDASRRRKPSRRSNRYVEFHRKGYGLLSWKYGISAREFADNVEGALQYGESYQACVPRDAEDAPQEMAVMVQQDLRGTLLPSDNEVAHGREHIEDDPIRLLSAARYLLAREILAEPRLVQSARSILQLESAMITATVTQSGVLNVGETHPLRGYVSVKDKPVSAFVGTTDFALMKRAESKGYCKISVRFEPRHEKALLLALQSSATVSPAPSDLVRKWNDERLFLAKEVFDDITKRLSGEVVKRLDKRTDASLFKRLTDAASRRLLVGPTRPFPGEDGAPRVMSIVVTNEQDEDPDPVQDTRDTEEAKARKSGAQPYQRPNAARVTFVNLDKDGMFLSSEEVFGKWLRRPARESAPPEIVTRIQTFLMKSKPEVIVIGLGSAGKDAVRMRGDLVDVVAKLLVKNNAEFLVGKEMSERASKEGALGAPGEQPVGSVDWRYSLIQKHIVSIPEDVARAYSLTIAASVALPVDDITLIEKRAIALGRLAQEPLSVYAGIAMEDSLAGRFEIHRLHYLATQGMRVDALRRALRRAVCTTGVDVNRMLSVPHSQAMLAFVGGLGPRKAAALVRKIESQVGEDTGVEALQSRKHLYAQQYLGRCVFMSAAGFLRIRDPTIHIGGSTGAAVAKRRSQLKKKKRRGRDEDDDLAMFDPLDDSRIHPENYNVAVKIADEALRDENGDMRVDIPIEEGGVSNSSRFIACVLDNTEGLGLLDLEKYANHLEKLGRGRLYETIKMVATEFQAPFKDRRVAISTPEARAEFYIAMGADPYRLRIGAEVTATNCIVNRNETGISCMLPHRVRGFITRQDFGEPDTPIENGMLRKTVSTGSELHCRILSFTYETFEARLTSRPSLLKDPSLIELYKPVYDKNSDYVVDYPSELRRRGVDVSRSSRGRNALASPARVRETRLKLRGGDVCEHENFHADANSGLAEELLRNAAPGEFIIRPSGTEIDCFVFTAKFADASSLGGKETRGMVHILCRVKNPMAKDHTTKFVVAQKEYDSLDELIATFLTPVIENMNEAMGHPKFRKESDKEMEVYIKAEKNNAPKRIPYFFTLPESKMLCLHLHCIPGKESVMVEGVKVVPDGFLLRNVLHKDLVTLVNWFKKNCRRLPAKQAVGSASPFIGAGPSSNLDGRAPRVPPPRVISAGVATPVRDEAPPRLIEGARGTTIAPGLANPYAGNQQRHPPPVHGQGNGAIPFGTPPPPPPGPSAHGVGGNGNAQSYGPPGFGRGWGAPGYTGPDVAQTYGMPYSHPQVNYGQDYRPPNRGVGVLPGTGGYGPPPGNAPVRGAPPPPVRGAPPAPMGQDDPFQRRGQMPIPAWKKNQQQQNQ